METRSSCPVSRSEVVVLALPSRWPPRPPFGFEDATLVEFMPCSRLRLAGTRSSGFRAPPRPWGRAGFIAVSSRLLRPAERYVRSSPDLEVFPACRAVSNGSFDRPPSAGFRAPSGNVHRAAPRVVPAAASLRVSPPSTVPVRTALPRPPRLGSGAFRVSDPRDAFVSVPDLPGMFRPGPSMGFAPGACLDRSAFVSRRPRALVPFHERGHEHSARCGFRTRLRRRSSPDTDRDVGVGPSPSWVFRLSRVFNRSASPLSRTPPQASRSAVVPPTVASRGNVPTDLTRPRCRRSSSALMRFAHLFDDLLGAGRGAAWLCVHPARRAASPRTARAVRPVRVPEPLAGPLGDRSCR
jgi:hypothetical protein